VAHQDVVIVSNKQTAGIFFTLLASFSSGFQVGIHRMFRLLMLKISASHYSLTMVVVVNFSEQMGATMWGVAF